MSIVPPLLIGFALIFWVLMLTHAINKDIPNKLLWLFVLLLGGIVGEVIYYFVMYRNESKKNKTTARHTTLTSQNVVVIALCILAILVLLFFISPPNQLKEVPLEKVIKDANNGRIMRIDIRGNKLEVTKTGESKPTLQSHKEEGSSLFEQGLVNKDVQINIRN